VGSGGGKKFGVIDWRSEGFFEQRARRKRNSCAHRSLPGEISEEVGKRSGAKKLGESKKMERRERSTESVLRFMSKKSRTRKKRIRG